MEIIPLTEMPKPQKGRSRSPQVKEILDAFETLPPDKCLKCDAGDKLKAKHLSVALRFYRNNRGRNTPPPYPNLAVCYREQFVFCWKEE